MPGSSTPSQRPDASSTADDETLFARFQSGDAAAFEMLVERYQHPLTNFANRLTLDYELACDVVQASFIEMIRWGRDHADEPVSKFRWLLYRITHRQSVDAIRRAKVRRTQTLDDSGDAAEGAFTSLASRLTTDDPGPDALALAEEEANLVRRMVDELPEDSRDALILRFFQGLSFSEIGEVLECREGTARQRVHYGLSLLRGRLGLETDGSPAKSSGSLNIPALIWGLLCSWNLFHG